MVYVIFNFSSVIIDRKKIKMIIDIISDLHGFYPKLKGGDLLILVGDYTKADKLTQWAEFFSWLYNQNYEKKILISGNHDNFFNIALLKYEKEVFSLKEIIDFLDTGVDFEYLCDSETEFCGTDKEGKKRTIKIWGSPWTKTFSGMNSQCKAFTVDTEEELDEKWKLIPADIDILITHSPPYDIFDKTTKGKKVGSKALLKKTMEIKPELHCFGHIHEHGGKALDTQVTKFVNASIVNEKYQHVNKPVRVIL